MSQRSIVLALVGLVCAVPLVSVGALTDDEIRAQINTLIGKIQNLQEGMKTLTLPTSTLPVATPSTTPTTIVPQQRSVKACARITKTLSFGARGNDVLELQTYLASTGDLTSDAVSGYFGAMTRAALRTYQAREGIVSEGDEQTTGWGVVGARTRARIACGSDNARGATLSVSQSGMSVTVRMTVNTRKSCAATTYTLEYGDRTPVQDISVPQNFCATQTSSFTHTYTAAGHYVISVTSGTLTVSLPVSIENVASCTPPSFSVSSVPSGMVGVAYTFPFASFLEDKDTKNLVTVIAEKLPQGITLANQASSSAATSTVIRSWSLVGTPVQAGTYTTSLTAQNRCGNSTLKLTLPITEAVRGINCPVYQQPVCGSGASLQSGGYGSNGCALPAVCVPNPVICPAVDYQIPQCSVGQHVETRYNDAGCRTAPICVQDSMLTATPSFGVAPLTVRFSWDKTLAPTGIDFGNGTIGAWQDGIPSGTTYTYPIPGTYTAILYKGVDKAREILGSVVVIVDGTSGGNK